MDLYEIVITLDAADDLSGLRSYIADALLAPDTARDYLDMLYMEMKNLSTLPKRNASTMSLGTRAESEKSL